MLTRLWKWFWSPTSKYSWGAIFVVGGIAGIIFWGGFNTAMEQSNTLPFCANACHEMTDFVLPEYQQSIHYTNAQGVRAICADCHVPKAWGPKVVRKIKATWELWGKITGSINTREKFEAKREQMALKVWLEMKENDSQECRNCHSYEAMDWHAQSLLAQRDMQKAMKEGKTCIDCHKGIGHTLPDGYESDTPVYKEDLAKLLNN
ncbi:NapC/NirT family cytochrome c [Nitrospira sp. MA-1]|nr:NapC/NirT family cytochrome c [Nitrospira sp. MA-1]